MAKKLDHLYDAGFFRDCAQTSAESAAVIVPLIVELVKPRDVVDVGCGLGTWTRAFSDCGVQRVLGIDGDHIDRDHLRIAPENFLTHDLTKPLDIDERFDLAVSLEVAEHLDESLAQPFVATLTSLAPVVLFSGAIPHQGGTHHLNEQWPNYWAEHFGALDFVTIDYVRPLLWGNERVAFYYAQNTLLFVHRATLSNYPQLAEHQVAAEDPYLSKVHPIAWNHVHNGNSLRLRSLLAALPSALARALFFRLRRLLP